MLTFNIILGYKGLLFRDFLMWFFLRFFFFQSDRPTDPISGNAFLAMLNRKKGDSLNWFSMRICDDQKYLSGTRLYTCINTQKFSSPNDEEVPNSSKKHTQFKTRVHNCTTLFQTKMVEIDTLFQTKTAKKNALWHCTYLRDYPPQGKNALQIMSLNCCFCKRD